MEMPAGMDREPAELLEPDQVQQYGKFILALQHSFGSANSVAYNKGIAAKFLRLLGVIGDKPWRDILAQEARKVRRPDGIVLEFGVYKARTANLLAKLLPRSTVYAFDSFNGFPGDGRPDWRQDFSLAQLPKVRKNVRLQVGFFEDTLPRFLAEHGESLKDELALIHIDCDIYSSTATVLDALGAYLSPSTVIVFDELVNYAEFAFNEALALYQFLLEAGLDARWSTNIGEMWLPGARRGDYQNRGWKEFRSAGFFQNQSIVLCNRGEGGFIDQSIELTASLNLIGYVVSGLGERGLLAR